jgi:ferredoxin like protein
VSEPIDRAPGHDAPASETPGGAPGGAPKQASGSVDAKLGADVFKLDTEPHIVIDVEKCRTVCVQRACLQVCPADLYELNDQGDTTVNWEGCLECGTCLICCDAQALRWQYPRGGCGVQYRMS